LLSFDADQFAKNSYVVQPLFGGRPMNTLERRQLVKARIVDVKVAKTAVNESRRERAVAAKDLRKALAATRYASAQRDTVSYPQRAAG
jgi:hypothetical protein